MKNTLLKFDYELVGDAMYPDYSSRKINLYDIVTELDLEGRFSEFFELYRMMDDDKLERISYSIYGTTDYWDILLQINDRNPLFEMPYRYDSLVESAEEFWNTYSSDIYFQPPLNKDVLKERIEKEIEFSKDTNELYRYIYVVIPSKMNEFLKYLRERKIIK